MLNPVHLRTLSVVVRTGSFADAARQIGYTGSAVSQQVAALEHSLRATLFERDAHSIRPTAAALFLAERAHDILMALGALEDDMRGLSSGGFGRLRVGGFAAVNERLLPCSLAGYRRSHPNVDLALDEGEPDELVAKLRDALLEVAVVYEYDLVPQRWPAAATVTPLLDEELFLMVPEGHALASAGTVAIEDLAAETWVSTREGSAGDNCLIRLCGGAGFDPLIAMRGAGADSVRGMVQAGIGIALVPALSAQSGDGTELLTLEPGLRRHVLALRRAEQESALAAEAVAALAETVRELVEDGAGIFAPGEQRRRVAEVEYLARRVAVAG
ncbi:LysR family transcriptional regulator [Microbacterium sp. X-17]|uniref:LysR family transcriptional regulator n=1 Tax=Microbacterium sp. X-17 TaxID=3144404 RepID=UPI0031F4ACCF